MKGLDSMSGSGENDDRCGSPCLAGGAWRVWITSCIVSLVIAILAMKMLFGAIIPVELISAWGLAVVNALLSLGINVIALRRQRHGFIAWGAIGNVLRVLAVLVIVLAVKLSGGIRFEPFVLVFLASYFVFMIAGIVRMNMVSLRSMDRK